MSDEFRALVLRQDGDALTAGIDTLGEEELPEGDVTVAVEYSSLNYKDAMVVNGNIGRLVRQFTHVPGIDFVGPVESSTHPDYGPADRVVLTGWRVGEAHWRGF